MEVLSNMKYSKYHLKPTSTVRGREYIIYKGKKKMPLTTLATIKELIKSVPPEDALDSPLVGYDLLDTIGTWVIGAAWIAESQNEITPKTLGSIMEDPNLSCAALVWQALTEEEINDYILYLKDKPATLKLFDLEWVSLDGSC